MSLATRCPACGTVFRVVPDQLKVSDGWVRCGRCHEVFDASHALIDLDGAVPMPGIERIPAPAGAANDEALPTEPTATAAATVTAATTAATSAAPATAAPASAAPASAATATAAATATEDPPRDEPGAEAALAPGTVRIEPQAATTPDPGRIEPPAAAPGQAATPGAAPHGAAHAEPLPGFVLRAQRAVRRRSPARRAALALAAAGLLVLLAGQIVVHDRDRIAAAWPPSAPALAAACGWIGCRVEAPRRIEALSVESSALLHIEGTALHRLQVVVRNRSPTPVRMPGVDLTLTDTLGQPVARRVFGAGDLGVAADSLSPQAEATMAATLDLSGVRVAGYSVELFYP